MSFYTNREIFYVPIWIQYIWSDNYIRLKYAACKIQRAYRSYHKRKVKRKAMLRDQYFHKSYRHASKKYKRKVKKSKMVWYETDGTIGTLKQAIRCAMTNRIYSFSFIGTDASTHYWKYKGKSKKWINTKSINKYGQIIKS